MGHEHDCRPERRPQRRQVVVELEAGDLVQGGERLIHQQDRRPGHQGAGDRYPHLHPPGQLARVGLGEAGEPDLLQRLFDAWTGLFLRHAGETQRQPDVGEHIGPWRQRRLLKYEAELRTFGLPDNLAARRRGQSRQQSQDRGLSATGRPKQGEKLARLNVEVEAPQSRHFIGEDLVDAPQRHQRWRGHPDRRFVRPQRRNLVHRANPPSLGRSRSGRRPRLPTTQVACRWRFEFIAGFRALAFAVRIPPLPRSCPSPAIQRACTTNIIDLVIPGQTTGNARTCRVQEPAIRCIAATAGGGGPAFLTPGGAACHRVGLVGPPRQKHARTRLHPTPAQPILFLKVRSMATDYVADNLKAPVLDHLFPNMIEADKSASTWPYFRKQIDHPFRVDRRNPTVGFINRDEASILYANARAFKGRSGIEVGAWRGWSTAYLVAAGVAPLHVVEPLLADPDWRSEFEAVVRVGEAGARWSFAFVDGDHDGDAPRKDALACAPYLETTAMVVFHDLVSPHVAAGLRALKAEGFSVMAYQTAQMMGVAWRGAITPVAHKDDPAQHWQVPDHLAGIRISGEA